MFFSYAYFIVIYFIVIYFIAIFASLITQNVYCVEWLPHTCLMRPYAKSCTWRHPNPWSTCSCSWNMFNYVLQICSRHCHSYFSLILVLCSLLCSENVQYDPVCHNKHIILRLGVEMSCRLCLVATPWRHPHLGIFFLHIKRAVA